MSQKTKPDYNALLMCNACESKHANPKSAAGYCVECETKARGQHTPEPWVVSDRVGNAGVNIDSLASDMPESLGVAFSDNPANAARIVVCVNAMEGHDNPVAFQEDAVNFAAWFREFVGPDALSECMAAPVVRRFLAAVDAAEGRKS
jgi:hypothetical protein